MAPRKPLKKPATKAKPAPLPPMATGRKEGVCGVDGYCCQGKSPEDCCGGSCRGQWGGQCGGGCGCGGSKTSLLDCHILTMLRKRAFWLGSLLSVITIGLFQWVWHGPVLMQRYLETATLWRPMADIAANGQFFIAHHIAVGVLFTLIFLLMGGYGLLKGIKNGLLIGALQAAPTLVVHATQPVPADILQLWALGAVLQGAVLGFVLSAVTSCGWCNSAAGCGCGGNCSADGKGCC